MRQLKNMIMLESADRGGSPRYLQGRCWVGSLGFIGKAFQSGSLLHTFSNNDLLNKRGN
jgi:hypothetical protein